MSGDDFFEQLVVKAATIDERLSSDFQPQPGQKSETDNAALRLAAWCRSCASGDWALFDRRLKRDGLSFGAVLARLAVVRRNPMSPRPGWVEDAIWIESKLNCASREANLIAWPSGLQSCPFENLFVLLAEEAEARLLRAIQQQASENLDEMGRACLRHNLIKALSDLFTPVIYKRLVKARKEIAGSYDAEDVSADGAETLYDRFSADLQAGGFRQLFEEKPVLLRLAALIARQWIDTSAEFLSRLHADIDALRFSLCRGSPRSRVTMIEGDLSDPHNSGRSVKVVRFDDGTSVVYKPKDLKLDAAWYALVQNLNQAGAPAQLKAVRTIAREGYGWTEFIPHLECEDQRAIELFFRRAGAWLALFHCFAATDMHQENMIAAGDHPVPIDLEMILQPADEQRSPEPTAQAFEAVKSIIANSVMSVGLLPAYGRSPENKIFSIGGMMSRWTTRSKISWAAINTDAMRPEKIKVTSDVISNLPHIDGRYAKLGDYLEHFVDGFINYAAYLSKKFGAGQGGLLDEFVGLPVRKLIRPTRFYSVVLQRLRDHRTMNDGAIWSAQVDFLARFSDWESDDDNLWPLQQSERSALLGLNVPHFTVSSDGYDVSDSDGTSTRLTMTAGLDRAEARLKNLDEREIGWQVAVTRQNTSMLATAAVEVNVPTYRQATQQPMQSVMGCRSAKEAFAAEATKVAHELSRYSTRKGVAAAWLGLDWLGDSEVPQLVPLGSDLYNGTPGIAVFLAAHAAVEGAASSRELALAAVSHLRARLRSRNGPRVARSLGLGAANGMGSIIYAFAVMSKCLNDKDLLIDALASAELINDDLIAADRNLDLMAGSAGGVLGLLRLFRDTGEEDVLKRAAKCGEHLLSTPRQGAIGKRSWISRGLWSKPLNGMAHGAAGYAYSLASLAIATKREDFAMAALECLAFENLSFDISRSNWPDFRFGRTANFPCKWCHGAPGIGLSRVAMRKIGAIQLFPASNSPNDPLTDDIHKALAGVERGWRPHLDTLCCGTLGSIEFLCEAGEALADHDLQETAKQRLLTVMQTAAASEDYRWNTSERRFNLGLFRGLAGIGYTCLRRVDSTLPNILIWD